MKPKTIKEGEPFILHNTTFTYSVQEGKIVLSKVGVVTNKVSSADFDKLWQLHSKGNKATAKERFMKIGHKLPIEKWVALLTEYVASNDFMYLKGLDVYLNPTKEHWNDPIVYKDGVQPVEMKEKTRDLIM
jgi:hypothetical protein